MLDIGRLKMKRLVVLFCALILIGCIEVDDLGGFWDLGEPDLRLVGSWSAKDDYDCRFTATESVLRFAELFPTNSLPPIDPATWREITRAWSDRTSGRLSRSLQYDGAYFLMVTGEPFNLRRYVVTSNRLEFLRFDDRVLEQAIRSGTVQGIIPDRIPYDPKQASVPNPLSTFQRCRISVLTTNTLNFLVAPENAKNWHTERSYTRQTDVAKQSLDHNRQPASDSTTEGD